MSYRVVIVDWPDNSLLEKEKRFDAPTLDEAKRIMTNYRPINRKVANPINKFVKATKHFLYTDQKNVRIYAYQDDFAISEVTKAIKNLGLALYNYEVRFHYCDEPDSKGLFAYYNLEVQMRNVKTILEFYCNNETAEIDNAINYFDKTTVYPIYKLTFLFSFLAARIKSGKFMIKESWS